MSKNAWEEPVVEFGTSHVSAGYTTEKDSMTSVVPQAKPKVFECSHMHTYIIYKYTHNTNVQWSTLITNSSITNFLI